MSIRRFIFIVSLISTIAALNACDRPEPEQVRQRQHMPAPDFVADADRGETLFHAHCSRCHGKAASGTDHGPPLIHPIYRPGHHADLTFYWAAKDGVKQHHWQFGDMPPVSGVSPEDVGHIVAYVRREQRRAGIR